LTQIGSRHDDHRNSIRNFQKSSTTATTTTIPILDDDDEDQKRRDSNLVRLFQRIPAGFSERGRRILYFGSLRSTQGKGKLYTLKLSVELFEKVQNRYLGNKSRRSIGLF
jgi:hypothetical protein